MSKSPPLSRHTFMEDLPIVIALAILAPLVVVATLSLRSHNFSVMGVHQAHTSMQSGLSNPDLVQASDWVLRQAFGCIDSEGSPFHER